MKKILGKKVVSISIILLFLCVNLVSGIEKKISNNDAQTSVPVPTANQIEKTVPLTLTICEKTGMTKHTIFVSFDDAAEIARLLKELKRSTTSYQSSQKTQQLQQELLGLLDEKDALPKDVSKDDLISLLQPPKTTSLHLSRNILPFQSKASEWFCNFATFGEGSAFPIIILPRLIPFLLTPIPRAFVWWSTPEGVTSVGGLISRTGFLAGGQQKGIALGFWGIGFSIFLPPIMSYGIFGYALYTRVTAEEFQFYPPNYPPEITQTDPADGQQMVPISTTELRFEISDANSDLMSYNVTTEPDIGSGSGGLKPDGTYSVPVSGLQDLTKYTCHIEVTDGKESTEKTFTFTTEAIAPIISNPIPSDEERDISMSISSLRFTLKDYQGDAMDYTVQTSPNIGVGSGTDVHDGYYTVPITGLSTATAYTWYLNVTDGAHWTRKMFSFETTYPEQFNPFDLGWQYRKPITIDHTKVAGDLVNFPVLVCLTDSDLRDAAQDDGDDILFMPNNGVAHKLNHEIESYISSTGTLVAWVNITALSSTGDTVFYMYYGYHDCLSKENVEQTWDANYLTIQHMKDSTSTTISDSTAHAYTGTKSAADQPIQSIGKIGNCQDFDGTDDCVDYTASIIPTGSKTISVWMKKVTNNPEETMFASSTGGSWNDAGTAEFYIPTIGMTWYMGNSATSGQFMVAYVPIPDITQWHLYTMTYDGTTLTVYTDASSPVSNTTKSGTEAEPTNTLRIGKRPIPTYCPFHGTLDEFKISNIARSYEYISTEYNNQNSPATFILVGLEEPHP
jgi:hypothetical protein